MKVTKIKQEVVQLNLAQLHDKLTQLKHGLFDLRINSTTAHVKDYSQFKKIRKDIARVFTEIQHKQLLFKQVNS